MSKAELLGHDDIETNPILAGLDGELDAAAAAMGFGEAGQATDQSLTPDAIAFQDMPAAPVEAAKTRGFLGKLGDVAREASFRISYLPNRAVMGTLSRLEERRPGSSKLAMVAGSIALGAIAGTVLQKGGLDVNHLLAFGSGGHGNGNNMHLDALTTGPGSHGAVPPQEVVLTSFTQHANAAHATGGASVLDSVSHAQGHSRPAVELTSYTTTAKSGHSAVHEAYVGGDAQYKNLHYNDLPKGGVEIRVDPHQGTTLVNVKGHWVPVDLSKEQLHDIITAKVNGHIEKVDVLMDHGVIKIPGTHLSAPIVDAIRHHAATNKIYFTEGSTREIVSTSVGNGHNIVFHGNSHDFFKSVPAHQHVPPPHTNNGNNNGNVNGLPPAVNEGKTMQVSPAGVVGDHNVYNISYHGGTVSIELPKGFYVDTHHLGNGQHSFEFTNGTQKIDLGTSDFSTLHNGSNTLSSNLGTMNGHLHGNNLQIEVDHSRPDTYDIDPLGVQGAGAGTSGSGGGGGFHFHLTPREIADGRNAGIGVVGLGLLWGAYRGLGGLMSRRRARRLAEAGRAYDDYDDDEPDDDGGGGDRPHDDRGHDHDRRPDPRDRHDEPAADDEAARGPRDYWWHDLDDEPRERLTWRERARRAAGYPRRAGEYLGLVETEEARRERAADRAVIPYRPRPYDEIPDSDYRPLRPDRVVSDVPPRFPERRYDIPRPATDRRDHDGDFADIDRILSGYDDGYSSTDYEGVDYLGYDAPDGPVAPEASGDHPVYEPGRPLGYGVPGPDGDRFDGASGDDAAPRGYFEPKAPDVRIPRVRTPDDAPAVAAPRIPRMPRYDVPVVPEAPSSDRSVSEPGRPLGYGVPGPDGDRFDGASGDDAAPRYEAPALRVPRGPHVPRHAAPEGSAREEAGSKVGSGPLATPQMPGSALATPPAQEPEGHLPGADSGSFSVPAGAADQAAVDGAHGPALHEEGVLEDWGSVRFHDDGDALGAGPAGSVVPRPVSAAGSAGAGNADSGSFSVPAGAADQAAVDNGPIEQDARLGGRRFTFEAPSDQY